MTIVVTGAYGQLGDELCKQIGSEAQGVDIDNVDLTNSTAVRRRLLQIRPKWVINCAAYTHVDQAEVERGSCRAVNVLGVENLVRACQDLGCPLVQISSDYVFHGEPDRTTPFSEADEPNPKGAYAETKREAEQIVAGYERHLIVRTCGLYARPGHRRAHNFVKTMLHLGKRQPRLQIVDDQRCTPSYVPHVARGIRFLAGLDGSDAAPWGIYHVTNSGSTTWYEFARAILSRAGMDVEVKPISTAEYGPSAPRPAYSVLDTTAYHQLGGPAMPDWEEGLAEFFTELQSGQGNGRPR